MARAGGKEEKKGGGLERNEGKEEERKAPIENANANANANANENANANANANANVEDQKEDEKDGRGEEKKEEEKKQEEGSEDEKQLDPWLRLRDEIQKHSEMHVGADESIELIESTTESSVEVECRHPARGHDGQGQESAGRAGGHQEQADARNPHPHQERVQKADEHLAEHASESTGTPS
jgi:hypothetical protein